MGASRKNADALKRLRAQKLPIDGNFEVPITEAVKFDMSHPYDGWEKHMTVDEARGIVRIDPMLARHLHVMKVR